MTGFPRHPSRHRSATKPLRRSLWWGQFGDEEEPGDSFTKDGATLIKRGGLHFLERDGYHGFQGGVAQEQVAVGSVGEAGLCQALLLLFALDFTLLRAREADLRFALDGILLLSFKAPLSSRYLFPNRPLFVQCVYCEFAFILP